MSFLNPWLLLGMLGIAIPIIIHLLNRFRRRRIDWGAMELLRRALVMRSRQIQLEDLLLLLLRCLAILLIALALARPTIKAAGAKWFGGQQQVSAVIALDGSYSMAFSPGVQSRFDRARESVRQIQKTLDAGDPVSLVLMGNEPRILLRNAAYEKRRFDQAMEEIEPLPETLNLEVCLEQIAGLVEEAKAPVRECYLLTDAQAITWGELSEKARKTLDDLASQAHVFFVPTPPDGGSNLCLSRLDLASGALRRNSAARFTAEVRNTGDRPQDQVAVTLLLNGTPVDRRTIERIEPGQTGAVPLFARFADAGTARLTARVERDPLLIDNERHTVARVHERVRVLCVDGEPSDRPFEGETAYLLTALVPGGLARSRGSLAVESVSWLEFSSRRLDEYEIVILANVPDLRPQQVGSLADFAQQGGGVVVFLGDKVDPRLVNERMQAAAGSLLPAAVQDAIASPSGEAEGWTIAPAERRHPLNAFLASLPGDLLAEVRVERLFRLVPQAGAETILTTAGGKSPLLVARDFGRGKVALCATTADREWTNLPIHPAYPILMHELVTWLMRRAHERPFTVGEPLAVRLSRQGVQTSVTFRDPSGAESPVQVTERAGRRIAEFGRAQLPGFYEVGHAEDGGSVALAVNVDPDEADVKALPDGDLKSALAGLPIRYLTGADNIPAAIRESRVGRELWRVLLIAGLLVLLLESYLAYRFSRKMVAAETVSPTEREKFLATESQRGDKAA